MPYPNEHACRLRSPNDFQKGNWARIKRGKLIILLGRLKGEIKTTRQAFRYPKEDWTEDEARTHCKENKGRFEPATNRAMNEAIRKKAGH